MAGGGVAELQFVGYGCGGLALLIIALAIPTTCILPYHEYALLHIVNYTLPLILVVASLRVAFAAQDGLALSVDVRQLMLRMTFAIGLIAVFFYDASLCNQVLNQVAKKDWGDLRPSDQQVSTLYWLYTFINLFYEVIRYGLMFGLLIATTIWILRTHKAGPVEDTDGGESGRNTAMYKVDNERVKLNAPGLA